MRRASHALLAAVALLIGRAAAPALADEVVLEIECDAMDASPDAKVRLAMERRELIRGIVRNAK